MRSKPIYNNLEMAVGIGVTAIAATMGMVLFGTVDNGPCPDPRLKSSADQTIVPTPSTAPTLKIVP